MLNALGFSTQHERMLLTGQSHKIYWAIVTSNAVQVMNHPTIRKGFAMYCFPYQKMFTYILMISMRMFRHVNQYISFSLNTTALPSITVLSLWVNTVMVTIKRTIARLTTLWAKGCSAQFTLFIFKTSRHMFWVKTSERAINNSQSRLTFNRTCKALHPARRCHWNSPTADRTGRNRGTLLKTDATCQYSSAFLRACPFLMVFMFTTLRQILTTYFTNHSCSLAHIVVADKEAHYV